MSVLRSQARNPLGADGPSMEEVDQAIFGIPGGSLAQLDEGRVVARPTPIMAIWADVKQPRRAIPISVRMHWDGNPLEVVALLEQWHQVAEQAADATFDVEKLLNGEGEGIDTDNFPSVTQEYLSLVRLAAGIKADGLINPITVIESDGKLLIESGERRWLAFHLLNTYLGDQWAKIPAAKGNVNDSVWRQATENTARRQLNPIGMARQIGLLIMAARGTPPIADGAPYLEYEEVVKNGTCDRRFYAQVADGNVHRIPKGMSERIEAAMDLSMEQISQYRRLLRLTPDELINDVLWTRADMENWAERTLRDISTLTTVKVSEVLQRPQWTLDDLKALKDVPVSKPFDYPPPTHQAVDHRPPVTSEWMHKTIRTKAGFLGVVVDVNGVFVTAEMEPDGKRAQFRFEDLTVVSADANRRPPVVPAPQPQRTAASIPGFEHGFYIGARVRTRTGHEGEVVGLSGRLISVRTANGTTSHDHTLLTMIAAPARVEQTKFVIGDHVITQYGRTGVVVGMAGMMVLVNWDNSKDQTDMNVLHLELVEEDGDPDVPAQPRQWSEGISIGSRDEVATDKADSQSQAEPKRIIDSDDDYAIFSSLVLITEAMGDFETANMLNRHLMTTDADVRSWGNAEQVSHKLNEMYGQLSKGLENVLTSWYAQQLQQLESAVN